MINNTINIKDFLEIIFERFSDILANKIDDVIHQKGYYSSELYEPIPDDYVLEDISAEISPIELLEFSKENINRVKKIAVLPEKINNNLSGICAVLSEIQEYLFNN